MAKIVYSDKFNNQTKTSYKSPSTMYFQDNQQEFEKYGVFFDNSTSGTSQIGSNNNSPRPSVKFSKEYIYGTPLTIHSLSTDIVKEQITYNYCNSKRKNVLSIFNTIKQLENIIPTLESEISTYNILKSTNNIQSIMDIIRTLTNTIQLRSNTNNEKNLLDSILREIQLLDEGSTTYNLSPLQVDKINTFISDKNNNIYQIPNIVSQLKTSLENANTKLTQCVDNFYEYYGNPDTKLKEVPDGNILPKSYPPKDAEIFGSNLNSCRDSQSYHSPTTIQLKQKKTRPVYGTERALDMTGPRIFDYSKNVNEKLPFDTTASGYSLQDNFEYKPKIKENYIKKSTKSYVNVLGKTKDRVRVDKNNTYCDNFNCSYDDHKYKPISKTYSKPCGTKTSLGGISFKVEKNPNTSEFMKNNIIGHPFDNVNMSSFNFRNKATFNNNDLINQNKDLNSLKVESQSNYITNTNNQRSEVIDQYFKQQTDKIKNNLLYRGGF
jgi:hypothetical protein